MQMEVSIFSSCISVYCLVHSNWWASPLGSLIASEPPCLSCQSVRGEVGRKQGWYLQDLDAVYFCLQPSKSAWTNLNSRLIQDSEKGIVLMMEFHPEKEMAHATLPCFLCQFPSLVVLFLLDHYGNEK